MTKIYCTYCKTPTHADTSCPYQLKEETMSNTPKPQANTLDKITTSPLADSGLSLERAIEKFPNIKAEVDALITEAYKKGYIDGGIAELTKEKSNE